MNSFGAKNGLQVDGERYTIWSLPKAEAAGRAEQSFRLAAACPARAAALTLGGLLVHRATAMRNEL